MGEGRRKVPWGAPWSQRRDGGMAVSGTRPFLGKKTLISLLDIGTTAEVAGRGQAIGGGGARRAGVTEAG